MGNLPETFVDIGANGLGAGPAGHGPIGRDCWRADTIGSDPIPGGHCKISHDYIGAGASGSDPFSKDNVRAGHSSVRSGAIGNDLVLVAHGVGCRPCVEAGPRSPEPVVSRYDASGGWNDPARGAKDPATGGTSRVACVTVSAGGAVPRKV
jgi:hypothetical protein